MSSPNPTPLAPTTDAFVDEIREIESIFAQYPGHRSVAGVGYEYVPLEDGCLVSLWDAWSRFLRELVLMSAAGITSGLSGVTYTPPNPRSESQVLADLQSNRRSNNFQIINGEPKWNGVVNLASIVSFLAIPNANMIVGAISSSSVNLGPLTVANPLEEIRICRNFVAHKTSATHNDMQRYFIGRYSELSSHMRQLRSGVEAFSEWCECLEALAGAAAQ